MAAYVIDAPAAIRLAEAGWSGEDELLAPTLLRSQTLSALHADSAAGRRPGDEAEAVLAAVDALRVRLLGDRVLRRTAWRVASELGWAETEAASTWPSPVSTARRWSAARRNRTRGRSGWSGSSR